jgi:type IV pilus assembly protein PilW
MMRNNNKGLTLIEMMIAMVIGLLVVGTVITIFITNVRSFRDNVAMSKLNQELRGVMTFISDEVKRTGYSFDPEESAFMDDLAVSADCIRYAYDEDADGVRDADERFGFQLNANAIEWANNNTAADCSTGTWEDITDTAIANITAFTVTPNPLTPVLAGSVEIYQLTVTISGQTTLSNNDVASRTITEVIRVRNDET